MIIDIQLSRIEGMLALFLHFGLYSLLSWRLIRDSADIPYRLVFVLCVLGQMILIFGFATDQLAYIAASALFFLWVSWIFLGYVADFERIDRLILSISAPIIAVMSVSVVYSVTS